MNTMEVYKVICRYEKMNRQYHNFKHIMNMLEELDWIYTYKGSITTRERDLLADAILYHDIVYYPGYSRNEEESIEVFKQDHRDSPDGDIVCELIMATKEHKKGNGKLQDIIIDLDLSILSSLPEVYAQYSNQIREECAIADDPVWIPLRLRFLKGMDLKIKEAGGYDRFFTSWSPGENAIKNRGLQQNITKEIEDLSREVKPCKLYTNPYSMEKMVDWQQSLLKPS